MQRTRWREALILGVRLYKMSFALYSVSLLVILALGGCHDTGPPVTIIVPDDYRGEFVIQQSPTGRDLPMHEGAFICAISRDGNLLVKSLTPFER